jgi:ribosomal protein S18 acetylase RimI-like enzyme
MTATAIVAINEKLRDSVNRFIIDRWFNLTMVVRGEAVDMAGLPGFVWLEKGRIIGLITYRMHTDGVCEIMSLDSLQENRGIASALIAQVVSMARSAGCPAVTLITTNDNIRALAFYQKRGFDMAAFYRDSVAACRVLKPDIPLIGDHGIPLRHEIELEMKL